MAGQGFDPLVAVNQNPRHQQSVLAAGVSVIVRVAPTNRLADLVTLMSSVWNALDSISPGQVVKIAAQPIGGPNR
jgi:hypothetical protein